MYYPSSENKGADQLRGYREADLRLCFRLCRLLVFPRGGSFLTCNPDSLLNFISQILHLYRSSDERHTREPSELLDIPAYRDPSFNSMPGYTEGLSRGRAGLTVSGLCSDLILIPVWKRY